MAHMVDMTAEASRTIMDVQTVVVILYDSVKHRQVDVGALGKAVGPRIA